MSTVRPVHALLAVVAVAALGCKNESGFIPTQPQVLENDHGSWLSMDVAPNGELAVTYYDRTRGAIGFASGMPRDDGTVFWDYEQVDGYPDSQGLNPGDRGKFTSMKIDETGRAWTSYYDASNGSLRVAWRDGGTWTSEVADTGSGLSPDSGQWTSLALDADGNPVVAEFDVKNGDLRVARRSSEGTWSAETVYEGEPSGDNDPAAGMYARLLIDGNTEYIAFYDGAAGDLHLLEGFPGAYTHTLVYAQGDSGLWPSIQVDGDTLRIAFQRADTQDLMLATRQGAGSFQVTTLDTGDYRGADTEVFTKDGQPAVLYFDGHDNDMWIAEYDGSIWTNRQVAGDGIAVGYHNEVAYTRDRWWAACYDYTNRRIFVTPL